MPNRPTAGNHSPDDSEPRRTMTTSAVLASTAATVAIGGIFTPSLRRCEDWRGARRNCLPSAWTGDPRSLIIIGMVAVLSAAAHAPPIAITMLLEMTNEFQLTIPVTFSCAVAHSINTKFGTRGLYGNPIEGDPIGADPTIHNTAPGSLNTRSALAALGGC